MGGGSGFAGKTCYCVDRTVSTALPGHCQQQPDLRLGDLLPTQAETGALEMIPVSPCLAPWSLNETHISVRCVIFGAKMKPRHKPPPRCRTDRAILGQIGWAGRLGLGASLVLKQTHVKPFKWLCTGPSQGCDTCECMWLASAYDQ